MRILEQNAAKQEVRRNWRKLLPNLTSPARRPVNGETSYVCPFCGNGLGSDGDGLTWNPKSQDGAGLKCFKCNFNGDIIRLYMKQHSTSYQTALSLLAGQLDIALAPYKPKNVPGSDFSLQEGRDIPPDPKTAYSASQSARDACTPPDPEEPPPDPRTGSLFTGPFTGQTAETSRPSSEPLEGPGNDFPSQEGRDTPHDHKPPYSAPQGSQKPFQAQAETTAVDYTAYYQECQARLQRDEAALSYLRARGICPETALRFHVGFDPEWTSPTATRKGKHPPRAPRLIIPCNAHQYETRDIRASLAENEKPFAKMNEGGKAIFNEEGLQGTGVIFITEGAFDALSILEIGETAIALNSVSTIDLFLKRVEQNPSRSVVFVICMDKDHAGQKAAKILQAGLQKREILCTVTDICSGFKDPNEAFVGNRNLFLQAVERARLQAMAIVKPDNVRFYMRHRLHTDLKRFQEAKNQKTGFSNLDAKIGCLYPGLYAIAATSSLGKTTFAHQMADQLAANGQDVIFFSLEQSYLELISKSFSRLTAQQDFSQAVTSLAIRRGSLPPQVLEAMETYETQVGDRLSIVERDFPCDLPFICRYIREYVTRTRQKPIVFLDYLQILPPSSDGNGSGPRNPKEAIDTTVTTLKRLSRELDIVMVVISSINRANYLTPIDFESLKESGGIEYTCDCIWGLQLQCLNDPLFRRANPSISEKRTCIREAKATSPRKIELVCLKNRYGISSFHCFFDYYPQYDWFVAADAPEQAYAPSDCLTL